MSAARAGGSGAAGKGGTRAHLAHASQLKAGGHPAPWRAGRRRPTTMAAGRQKRASACRRHSSRPRRHPAWRQQAE
eukprot:7186936-Pyramimonas_sp.AAC.1